MDNCPSWLKSMQNDGGTFDEVNYNPKTDYNINELGKLLIRYAL